MNKNGLPFLSAGTAKWILVLCSAFALMVRPAVGDVPIDPGANLEVGYDPGTVQTITVELAASWSYTLTIKAPDLTGPTTVTLQATVQGAPAGASYATAASYLSFSQPTLSFSAAGETKTVVVSFAAPATAPTGDYKYFINTAGWPPLSVDGGTYVNMHTIPPTALQTPVVTIDTPPDGSEYIYTIGGPDILIPISISGTAPANAPVLTLTATISAEDANGGVIMLETPLTLVVSGGGTAHAVGMATLPVSVAGTYTISAADTNSIGSASDINKFVVKSVLPPPTVVINPPTNNPTYTYTRGLTSQAIPFTYVATSINGGIQTLTATLDGNPITNVTPTGLGTLVATGSGTFIASATSGLSVGQHTITVTATDPQGTASAAATFVIAELVPAIAIDLQNPLDGAVILLPPDKSQLNIPYNFVSSVTQGGTVKSVSATLTTDSTTTALTLGATSALNSPTVTGSGTLLNVLPGVYTLGATATNSDLGLTAFDSATFTVTPPPPPTIVFTQAPQPTYTTLKGYPLSIPFAIQTSSTGAYIATQTVTLEATAVTGLTSTANGTSLTATGGATLTIPAADSGTTTYTLVATGTDTYGQTVSTTTTFDVTVNVPVITIAINPQILANSPYTMPASGALSIPFVLTGNISTGATVDTISGNLGGTTNVTIGSYSGLGTAATATGSGNLSISGPGTYTLTATDTNTKSGISATTSVTFVVKAAQVVPPPLTVTLTQAPLPSYTFINNCSPLSIPITFVGRSNNGSWGGNVSTMTATLDGKPVTLSTVTGIGSPTATATATLSISSAGTHVLVVKDTDPYNQTATATASFVVIVQSPVISVTINSPTNNAVYYLPAGSGSCGGSSSPISIPFSFTSTITGGASVDALNASLNGCSVTFTKNGLGTSTATGTGSLSVSRTGTYTLSVKGIDNGCGGCNGSGSVSATASVTFTLVKAGPPTIAFTQPPQTSYTTFGCTPLSVPFAFKAISQAGGISSLSATLDGQCVSLTSSGLGSLNATGSGTLGVSAAGSHVLCVAAKDPNGTTSAKFTFTVTVQNPTPTVTIVAPADGAVFSYVAGDAAPSIPFTIVAKTSTGATVSSLKATLNGCNVAISNSGVGSGSVTGTGTLSICGPGTYTLAAVTVSGCVNATGKITFTVKQTQPPTSCTITWKGAVCDGTSLKGGYTVPVKCQVNTNTASGSCATRDTTIKFAVSEVYSNGTCSTAKIYSSANYSIDSSNVYCLNVPTSWGTHRYRVDAYCYPNGGTATKLAGSKEFKTQ